VYCTLGPKCCEFVLLYNICISEVLYSRKEEDIAILLIKNKANVSASNKNDRTAAHLAVDTGLFSVLKAVLEAGASPNKQVTNLHVVFLYTIYYVIHLYEYWYRYIL
jgi:ankyrin repeat protein